MSTEGQQVRELLLDMFNDLDAPRDSARRALKRTRGTHRRHWFYGVSASLVIGAACVSATTGSWPAHSRHVESVSSSNTEAAVIETDTARVTVSNVPTGFRRNLNIPLPHSAPVWAIAYSRDPSAQVGDNACGNLDTSTIYVNVVEQTAPLPGTITPSPGPPRNTSGSDGTIATEVNGLPAIIVNGSCSQELAWEASPGIRIDVGARGGATLDELRVIASGVRISQR